MRGYEGLDHVQAYIDDYGDCYSFQFVDFLALVHKVRELELVSLRDITKALMLNPRWRTPLARRYIPNIIIEMGILLDAVFSCDMPLVIEHVEEGTKEFEHANLVEYLCKVCQVARRHARYRETAIVQRNGLAWDINLELRTQFSCLSTSGIVNTSEVASVLTAFCPRISPEEADVKELMKEVFKSVRMESPTARQFQRSVAMHLHKARGHLRHPEGYEVVLSFEGFVGLLSMVLN